MAPWVKQTVWIAAATVVLAVISLGATARLEAAIAAMKPACCCGMPRGAEAGRESRPPCCPTGHCPSCKPALPTAPTLTVWVAPTVRIEPPIADSVVSGPAIPQASGRLDSIFRPPRVSAA
jgi:hypothetical protein